MSKFASDVYFESIINNFIKKNNYWLFRSLFTEINKAKKSGKLEIRFRKIDFPNYTTMQFNEKELDFIRLLGYHVVFTLSDEYIVEWGSFSKFDKEFALDEILKLTEV